MRYLKPETRKRLTGFAYPSSLGNMLPDTDLKAEPGMRTGIVLRADRFDQMTAALGYTSDIARSRELDVNPKTIYLARHGVIGERFITAVLTFLARHADKLAALNFTTSFEEVFEVGEKEAKS